jgi:hypothetical protein
VRKLAALSGVFAFAAIALASAAMVTSANAADTVTISGRAYAFNHMDTFLEGATIKVREIPSLSATTDANGDYVLAVPDDTNITPYIEPPAGYNQIDLQTFHTRGQDIENANFQTPADAEFAGLAAILSVPLGDDGRPTECAIVTTASARNVRGVDYDTFHQRTPHGVPGATSEEFPALDGPIYFNEFVIPDTSKTETSEDGGIVWTEVPTGTYRIATSSPTTRFASFLATCEPGRVINANPPWGAYELSPGEEPLGAGVVASSATEVKAKDSGKNRKVVATIEAGEVTHFNAVLRKGGKRIGHKRIDSIPAGTKDVKIPVRASAGKGGAKLTLKLRDAAGDVVESDFDVRPPSG